MAHFVHRSLIDAPAAAVFAFHERADAFELLVPPWQNVQILEPPRSLEVGTRVRLVARFGPFSQLIEAEHVEYEAGRMFADRMNLGPFKSWLHRHIVEPRGETRSELIDDITYELPLGALGRIFGGPIARRQLKKLFGYRHEVTRAHCEAA